MGIYERKSNTTPPWETVVLSWTVLRVYASSFRSLVQSSVSFKLGHGRRQTSQKRKRFFHRENVLAVSSWYNIPPITSCFVKEQINSMSTTKDTGLDKVPVRLLKLCVKEIADSLTSIINLSFETATFPNIWKIARVTPIFKSGDKSAKLNYRPISVLPVISKICERHVHVTFLSWLQKFRLLIENQSAYLKNHSCITALIDITDTLLFNTQGRH